MPPRSKAKIQNEPKKEEILPVVQQIKTAMTPGIPIEQVVYLNDSRIVDHDSGSNRYWVNYPDTWRTVSNQQLVLGVRAIRKYWANLRMEISLTFKVKEVSDQQWNFVFQAYLMPNDMAMGKEKEFVARINEQWSAWVEELSETDKGYLIDIVSRQWLYYYEATDECYVIRTPCPTEEDEFTGDYTVNITDAVVSRDIKLFFSTGMFSEYNPKSGDSCIGMTFKPKTNAFKYINDTYLLAASFVGQTNYQYLGFTNTEFNPPKQYVIPIGDTRFWIDVVTADAIDPVELDFRDMVAIELQLTTIPLQKYV